MAMTGVFFVGRFLLIFFVNVSLFTSCQSKFSLKMFTQFAEIANEYVLPEIGFLADGLEPYIDSATVTAHYKGHHHSYTRKLNEALQAWRTHVPDSTFAFSPLLDILQSEDSIPELYRRSVHNNGGGYLNHCLYWATMTGGKDREEEPSDALRSQLEASFGSMGQFHDQFFAEAMNVFGSGYVWLSRKPGTGSNNFVITTTANQDSPVSEGLQPILVLDLWEHAYYLQHKYSRPVYVEHWWKVTDWKKVEQLLDWWKHEELLNLQDQRDEF